MDSHGLVTSRGDKLLCEMIENMKKMFSVNDRNFYKSENEQISEAEKSEEMEKTE